MSVANTLEGLHGSFDPVNLPTNGQEYSSRVNRSVNKPEATSESPDTHRTFWSRVRDLLRKINPS